MRRALVVLCLWLGLAVVSTGVGLATVGLLQQRVGEAVSRPLTSAEVAAALDDESETVPAVPGLSRPTSDGDDDADDRTSPPASSRSAGFTAAGDSDDDEGSGSDSSSPRPAVTADPSRPSGSGSGSRGSGASTGRPSSDDSHDEDEGDEGERRTRSPRPSGSDRHDDEDRPSSSGTERSGHELARSASAVRRVTTLSRLHRARVTTTPHVVVGHRVVSRHVLRHVVRHPSRYLSRHLLRQDDERSRDVVRRFTRR